MTLATMTSPTKTLDLPDPNDPAACSRWLQDRYMKSERDDDFIDALQEILETDSQGNLTATPLRVGLPQDTRGLMVLGQSGYGKTSLVKRNLSNQTTIGLTDGNEPGAALYHLVPPEATLKSVAVEIANACGYPKIKDGIQIAEAWDLAMHRLSIKGITILWIDEAHHLLTPGPGRDPKLVVRRLKNVLQGQNAVAMILTGVPALYDLVLPDKETDRRFVCLNLEPVTSKNEAANLRRYLEMCCEKVGVGMVDDPSFLDRLLMANQRNLGKSIEMTLRAIRRAHRRPERQLSFEDFRRSQTLQNGQKNISPFDQIPWPLLKVELEKLGWIS